MGGPLILDLVLLLLLRSPLGITSPPIRSVFELVLLTLHVLLGELLEALVVLSHLLHEVTILVEWHLCLLGDR
jgi:hypothetical protein